MTDFDPTEADLLAKYLPGVAPGPLVDLFDDDLPSDIAEVWGEGRRTVTGALAADVAREMIASFGEDGFRRSALHRAALDEIEREKRLMALRSEYMKAHRKKEKV